MASHRLGGVLMAVTALFSPLVLADVASAEAHPSSTLTLTVQPSVGATSTVLLHCGPAGGSHPSPQAACDEITLAGGDFDRLPDKEGTSCTMEHQPVTVSAVGRWKCANVSWTRTYGNACQLHVDTGSVFA
jgi:hypothetical protein